MNRYSPHIDALTRFLRDAGCRVNLHAHKLKPLGRYYERRRSILLNAPDAKLALLVLAHEAGHWMGYRLNPGPETRSGTVSTVREREAHRFGWMLLRAIRAPIPRREWDALARVKPEGGEG